jgi:RNA polymerase sigma-70 factor, ECF subfamily
MDFLCALTLAVAPGAVVPFVRPGPAAGELAGDECDLVQGAIAGKRTAQHTLYARHYERVRSRIGRLLGRSSEVDDVLQDTFVEAFRDIEQLNDSARFGSWVCGIAVHQVHRRLRRRKLLQRLGFEQRTDEAALAQSVDPAASPETHLLLKQLSLALTTLAPRQHVAWLLRHVEGCSLDEVASHCRISLATAKRDIAQAELQLSALLFDQGNGNGR